ncbi:MAG: hypothetical protein CMO44_01420 [Verrucomicrobiales bacterium]|nr:hypothetical protein [Verrucomicrobiales bacterium]|tara:strand:- start:673 stop:951 length:279 start_codon:yes stop_codon:yes gene_type:complete
MLLQLRWGRLRGVTASVGPMYHALRNLQSSTIKIPPLITSIYTLNGKFRHWRKNWKKSLSQKENVVKEKDHGANYVMKNEAGKNITTQDESS